MHKYVCVAAAIWQKGTFRLNRRQNTKKRNQQQENKSTLGMYTLEHRGTVNENKNTKQTSLFTLRRFLSVCWCVRWHNKMSANKTTDTASPTFAVLRRTKMEKKMYSKLLKLIDKIHGICYVRQT